MLLSSLPFSSILENVHSLSLCFVKLMLCNNHFLKICNILHLRFVQFFLIVRFGLYTLPWNAAEAMMYDIVALKHTDYLWKEAEETADRESLWRSRLGVWRRDHEGE